MKIKCLNCYQIIESKHRHNLVNCKCGNCYMDGGQDYLHFGGNDFNKILIIFDDGTETVISGRLNDLEERFREMKKFLRIHQSYLVNMDKIVNMSNGKIIG